MALPAAFGLFDHLDSRPEPAHRTYADRIEFLKAAEAAGFRGWHLAEHHGTPLGLAPSPGIFIAAAAQATQRLRLGPMVYCLPLYEPLRLVEEICMLDHLSGGRLEVGVGRGVSPYETAFYNIDPAESVGRYVEALEVIRRGLRDPVLDFEGKHYRYSGVPMVLRPLQESIPFWSAAMTEDALRHAAAAGMHVIAGGTSDRVRTIAASYRRICAETGNAGAFIGASRLVHVARDDAQARARAAAAFEAWYEHLSLLWRRHGGTSPLLAIDTFEKAEAEGSMLAGSPQRVHELLAGQMERCGYNYPVLEFCFGDLGHRAEMESLALFAEAVMPAMGLPGN